jgi:hypothetical protein
MLLWVLTIQLLPAQDAPIPWEQYLRESAVSKQVIDTFLDPQKLSWAQFDRPARINTYGNSFTQCHQVSDGETWQEYLAAHLGEPVRNFGMGGYGVYQSFLRMQREEKTDAAAKYLVLYIWGDDHLRSLWRCRHAAIYKWWDHDGGRMFHNNFWPNVEMDLETGRLVEKANLLPTPEALQKMTDPDWMYQTLKDDLALQMHAYSEGLVSEIDNQAVARLSGYLGLPAPDSKATASAGEEVENILYKYGFEVTKYILAKARAFADENDRELMVIVFDPYRAMKELIETGERYDQEIVDYLDENGYSYFDMNVIHAKDFRSFNISLEGYMKRYFVGHYNPHGNHFFAFALKQKVVDWLDPKPITYRGGEAPLIDFKGYLPGN